ncbi:two-component regulator propeller domain-containing protein [Saccharicrinis sp. FJH62]|uniref:hybrid sensor histidine kinase/response regulator transcription factor n=1 Tax=Saccharicrinis sp. FJH62 TaxID=3344657 RepID=UPI0035D51141
MKIFRFFSIISVILLVCSSYLSAFTVQKLGTEDGLSSNNIISIDQDKEGFIWIATKNGLNRFDANSFKVFKASENDTNTISSNVLNCVYADPNEDVIWIATEKSGVDIYNYKTHQFKHYKHDYSNTQDGLIADGVTHITGDSKGNIWLATYQAGLDYFDKKNGSFTHYNQSNIKGLGSDYNWYVMPYNDNTIYVGHVAEGLSIIDLSSKSAVNFRHDPTDPSSLPDNTVTCLFKDSKDRMWIGTRNGLSLFDPDTYKMINFKNKPEDPNSLSYNFIKGIVETKEHKLWIGTEGGGITIMDLNDLPKIFDPKKVSFTRIGYSDTNEGLSWTSVQSIIKDSFGNIWAGGYAGGLNFIPARENFFHQITYLPYINNINSLADKSVSDLYADGSNNILIANGNGGIGLFNKGSKLNLKSTVSKEDLSVSTVLKDSDNHIWTGTYDGKIYRYHINTGVFERIDCFYNPSNIPVYRLFEDSRKNLWICTDAGLFVYNITTKECHNYTSENSGLGDNIIRTINEDRNHNLWVGTLIGGLYVLNEELEQLYNYGEFFDFYCVNDIYKDSENRMWVASQNDLFLFKDLNVDSVKRFGIETGLPENDIRAIMQGTTANDIWLSTTNGISYFNLKSVEIQNFTTKDNIIKGDYMIGAATKTMDGTIYFGSQNGITWFNEFYKPFTDPLPQIHITGLSINLNPKNNLNQLVDVPVSDKLKLKYDQNTLQIDFNILDYSLAKQIEYMYQMKGLDEGWYFIDGNQVTFRNLKPGDYTFNLKSRLHNKTWNTNVTAFPVIIEPPLWFSWWAKILYFFITVTIVYLIVSFFRRKIAIENALQNEKEKHLREQQLNEEKIRFFTNITHELRTPMTLILGPLEDLVADRSVPPALAKKINSIHRVATRLLQLINQILEFRKAEKNSRKLRVVKGNFSKYVYECGSKYQELHHNNKIDFRISLSDQNMEMFYDPEVITIILDNLLANAFKYTQRGFIVLSLNSILENNVEYTEISVSDTGFGISEHDLPFIFDRYYQAKNTSYPVSGTGIGLALVKSLVDLHEGEIYVESKPEKGSTFKVRLVTHNSYPDAVHIEEPEPQPEETEEETDNFSREMILVVDDNLEIIEYISESLSDLYQVITAENGKKGYELAGEKVPDIIISDIMMPVMDGVDMCKKIKTDIRTSHIPVILLTAKGSLQDKSEGYDAGADSYLTKPFSGNLLKSRIKNILDNRKRISESYTSIFKDKQQLFNESANQIDKEFLVELNTIIEENLEDDSMNISHIADKINMSHSTLYRKIKALTDLTAAEYIRKIRLKRAEGLLLENKYTINEVMYKSGFNSPGYFRQCFKDEFGISPGDYVRKLKAN